jgi:hypothetical protein
LGNLIGGKMFDLFRVIDETIAGGIVSSELAQGARRAARRKQRGLSSNQCSGEPNQEAIAVISQVNDRGLFGKQVSKGSHV